MSNAEPGAGDVRLELDGGDVVLKCTPGAAMAISRMHPESFYGPSAHTNGGVAGRIMACDLDMMCAVIRAGAGLGQNAVKNLPDLVFAFGLLDMRGKLATYIGNLANGGRPASAGVEAEDDNPPG